MALPRYHCQLCWSTFAEDEVDPDDNCPTCLERYKNPEGYYPLDVLMGSTVLASCRREGDEGDWWKEQHRSCTGSMHVGPKTVVLCDCDCHDLQPQWPMGLHGGHWLITPKEQQIGNVTYTYVLNIAPSWQSATSLIQSTAA